MNIAIASASSPGAATALPPARAPLSASVQRRLEGYSYDGSYYYYSYGGNSCARGCPEEWRDDGVCDAACNVDACEYDGTDCFHDADECYTAADGNDYRGKVAKTKTGRACQTWSEQIPWHHTKTTINFPYSGLGGHNFCRNPDGEAGPWCYTLDYPDTRWELCSVPKPSAACGADGAAAKEKKKNDAANENKPKPLELGVMADGHVKELELNQFTLVLAPEVKGIKIVLLPINGDCDLLISFSEKKPTRATATWVIEDVGVKQFTLARSNLYFCPDIADGAPCPLHLAVSGFEEGDYKLAVYEYDADDATNTATNAAAACSAGCDELLLGNMQCDTACNTSACIWDSGDCSYFGEYEMEELCATGCPVSWLNDAYCDEACFNAACGWDGDDCVDGEGCSDGCLPSWIDDRECDEVCNTEVRPA